MPPAGGPPGPGGPGGPRPGGPGGDGPRRPGGRRFGGKGRYTPRRKVCAFCVDKIDYVDYKDVARLRRYLSDRGKIEPRRKTGTCAKHQRALTDALKVARFIALLPYTGEHIRLSAGVGTRNAPLPPAAPGIAQPRGQFMPAGMPLPRGEAGPPFPRGDAGGAPGMAGALAAPGAPAPAPATPPPAAAPAPAPVEAGTPGGTATAIATPQPSPLRASETPVETGPPGE